MSSKKKRKSKNLSSPMNIFIFSILFVLAYRLVKNYLNNRNHDVNIDEKPNETVEEPTNEVKNELKMKIPVGVYITVIVVILLYVIYILSKKNEVTYIDASEMELGSAPLYDGIDASALFSSDTEEYTIQQNNRIIEDFYNDMNNLQKELDVKKS